jgi:phosphatidylserine decarboxylase
MSSILAEGEFAPTQKTASLLFVKNYRNELSYAGTRLSKVTVGLVAALVGA